ncbi:hypothetical protein [Flagellimonas marina]|uniref:Lipoprotein n=1 Tax=Flagellimonas marina TaxID=1775168 RepID=A0ABV8PM01_9FLAO
MRLLAFLILLCSCNRLQRSTSESISAPNDTIPSITKIQNLPVSDTTISEPRFLSSARNKQLLLKFYGFFEKKSISISDFEEVFGSFLVEEEELFFTKCLMTNSEKSCNSEFDNCIINRNECQSLLFEEIRKYDAELLMGKDYDYVKINYLDKIDDANDSVTIGNVKFLFSKSEDLKAQIISQIKIGDKPLFELIREEW